MNSKQSKQLIPPIAAMICIVILEILAMQHGIDGKVLALSVAALSGLGGFTFGRFTKMLRGGDSE